MERRATQPQRVHHVLPRVVGHPQRLQALPQFSSSELLEEDAFSMLRPDANSVAVRKRIENHSFEDEEGEEYEASSFGGFTDYFRRKKIKLQNLDAELRSSSSEKPRIFRGVVAHVNGYTQPSLNDLHRLIVTHGGGFMQYLDGKTAVTHIVASSLTLKKRVEFRKYRIVKPAWVVESVRAGKLLPWDDFRVVDEGRSQKVLGFDDGKVVSQITDSQVGYKEQTRDSWYTSQVQGELNEPWGGGNAPFPNSPPAPFDNLRNSGSSAAKPGHIPANSIQDRAKRKRAHGEPMGPSEAAAQFDGSSRLLLGYQRNIVTSNLGHGGKPNKSTVSEVALHPADDLSSEPESELSIVETCMENLMPTDPRVEDGGQERSEFDTALAQNEENQPQECASAMTLDSRPSNGPRRSHSPHGTHSKRPPMTAEEHNAVLLADPRIRKTSVLNPDFLKQYYSESRLHHLSAWKADLKSQLQQLTAAKSSSQKARHRRSPGSRRYIFHVDFDSFFAAVSLKSRPELKDKPVVVAHGSGGGSEIASCNYPARKFGIKNGMWMKQAQQLCPDIKVLPYDFLAYEEASRCFYDAILSIDGAVQSVSIDEALIDVSTLCLTAGGCEDWSASEGNWREQAKADEMAKHLRDEVRRKTGCEVSVGIGGNVLLAKVALRKAKPAGQYQIKPEEVLDFVGNLTVQDLPGVAYNIGTKLGNIGVKFVKDIHNISREKLLSTLGPKTGEKLLGYSRGFDHTEVGDVVVRKSVSADVNWGVRFENQKQAEDFVFSLSGELHKRLMAQKVKGRHLTMKIMRRAADAPLDPPKHLGHGKCDVFNKSVVLGVATNAQDVLGREAISVLRSFGFSPGELRGIGMQMTKLEPLKGARDGQMESSQKVLQFKTSTQPKREQEDPIVDDIESPQRKTSQRSHPAALTTTGKGPHDSAEQKPLNTLGTQFIIPSQIDPGVVAELPEEIRSKITGLTKPSTKSSRVRKSPALGLASTDAIPTQSQLDQETLDALPPDIREEILTFYRPSSSPPSKLAGQALVSQSLRAGNSGQLKSDSKKPTAPKKKTRAGPSAVKGGKGDSNSTLTQSAFIRPGSSSGISGKPKMEQQNTDNEEDLEELDPDFLAALPPDIRHELLSQSRIARLKRTANLSLITNPKTRPPPPALPPIQRFLRLPHLRAKPTFTTQKLSSLPELRDVILAWHEEFRAEGPYEEDVEALNKYLRRVVCEERNLAKAGAVVRWLGWVVGNGDDDVENEKALHGKEAWEMALHRTEEAVQAAVKERGLGRAVIGANTKGFVAGDGFQ
ncbi:MAG: deoxycytidyl transferase [Geoglossum umbratile]|nr:MAG: deoxycytidyl transferase [Geoglossum umbratile]